MATGGRRRAGVKSFRSVKDGNRAYYWIAHESLFELCQQVCGSLRRQVAELGALLQAEREAAHEPRPTRVGAAGA